MFKEQYRNFNFWTLEPSKSRIIGYLHAMIIAGIIVELQVWKV
jgi:uncharacterized membrane protein